MTTPRLSSGKFYRPNVIPKNRRGRVRGKIISFNSAEYAGINKDPLHIAVERFLKKIESHMSKIPGAYTPAGDGITLVNFKKLGKNPFLKQNKERLRLALTVTLRLEEGKVPLEIASNAAEAFMTPQELITFKKRLGRK